MPATFRGTAGQYLLRETLPADVWDGVSTLDKKNLSKVLGDLARQHPEKYRDVTYRLMQLGKDSAYFSGGDSFGLDALLQSAAAKNNRLKLRDKLDQILDDDSLNDKARSASLIKLIGTVAAKERDEIYDESVKENNPLANQLIGAGRGNKLNLAALRGSDWLYQDAKGTTIPVPVEHSFSQGLTPLEYLASTYGARQGVLSTKFAVQDSGFLGKQLNQITHRLIVTGDDYEQEPATTLGLPVDVSDKDNEGALLARDVEGFARNTVLTPKILRALANRGVKRILVRSPTVGGAPDGGIYAKDAGVREYGRLPNLGEFVGMTAAQALAEPVSQGLLGAKHGGGVAGASAVNSGFAYINQLVQTPKTFRGGATHAQLDGKVTKITPAPAGGNYVFVGSEQHYVPPSLDLKVEPGQEVEAGDTLSAGIPDPAQVTKHKGVGEGRRYFAEAFRAALKESGLDSNRRNSELLARGLINHVRMTEEMGDYAPDDVVPYSVLASSYNPREGYQTLKPKAAVGRYLERPYLHYSIGTKVRPSMLKDFEEFGVEQVDAHQNAPPFEPEMLRGMANLQHDPDWLTREFGSYLKGGFLDAVHRGGTSDERGTSFVPSLAKAVNFGDYLPKPGAPQTKLKLSEPLGESHG